MLMKELTHEKACNLKLDYSLWMVNNIDILHQIKTIGLSHPLFVQFHLLNITNKNLLKP
jgi:hypothetical protein